MEGSRMKRIVPVLFAWVVGAAFPSALLAKTPVDLVLALGVDVSRSVDYDEGRLQRQGYIDAFRDPQVIQAIGSGMLGRIAVGYYEWAGEGLSTVVQGWTLIEDSASAHAFADALTRQAPEPKRRTSISGAIAFGLAWLDQNDFEGTRRVIDISGDGPNNSGDLVVLARDRAVAAGVTVNGLPIMDMGTGGYGGRFNIPNLDLYFRDCVIGGPGAFIVVARNFSDFARAVRRKLILEIANRVPPPDAPRARFLPAQAGPDNRASPPCNVGEQMLRYRNDF
jgi:hypothetical protein